jgi:hypothetical protein
MQLRTLKMMTSLDAQKTQQRTLIFAATASKRGQTRQNNGTMTAMPSNVTPAATPSNVTRQLHQAMSPRQLHQATSPRQLHQTTSTKQPNSKQLPQAQSGSLPPQALLDTSTNNGNPMPTPLETNLQVQPISQSGREKTSSFSLANLEETCTKLSMHNMDCRYHTATN